MKNIREIMNILGCSQDQAFKVYALMDIDFSECTDAEFKRAVYMAWDEVK